MQSRVVLTEVIGTVGAARLPKNVELPLTYPIPQPIELHVNGLGLFLIDSVIGNAAGGAVVSLE